MNPSKRAGHRKKAARGISLLIVVVMVMALCLMTLTAFTLARNQYNLVGNIQHIEQAFNQTEAVLATAENWLNTGNHRAASGFTTYSAAQAHLRPIGHLAASGIDTKTMSWDDSNSLSSGDGRYLIEQLARGHKLPGTSLQLGQRSARCRAVDLFRVQTRSNAARGASRTIESIYGVDGC
jgi:Tfp pilus assembly protein PilX